MLRALVRVVLVIVIVVAAAAFLFGYRWGGGGFSRPASQPAAENDRAVGTTGADTEALRQRARETGADIGEKVAVGAERAAESIEEARLTAKVKSKMALDDTLDGSRIHVSTEDQQVTLTGTVINEAQHARALALARETDGVSGVVDHLSVGSTAR